MLYDWGTGVSRGIGFVTFATKAEADRAIATENHPVDGATQHIKVSSRAGQEEGTHGWGDKKMCGCGERSASRELLEALSQETVASVSITHLIYPLPIPIPPSTQIQSHRPSS